MKLVVVKTYRSASALNDDASRIVRRAYAVRTVSRENITTRRRGSGYRGTLCTDRRYSSTRHTDMMVTDTLVQLSRTTSYRSYGTQLVVMPRQVNHGMHLLLSILTGGLWIPVWLIVAIRGSRSFEVW